MHLCLCRAYWSCLCFDPEGKDWADARAEGSIPRVPCYFYVKHIHILLAFAGLVMYAWWLIRASFLRRKIRIKNQNVNDSATNSIPGSILKCHAVPEDWLHLRSLGRKTDQTWMVLPLWHCKRPRLRQGVGSWCTWSEESWHTQFLIIDENQSIKSANYTLPLCTSILRHMMI